MVEMEEGEGERRGEGGRWWRWERERVRGGERVGSGGEVKEERERSNHTRCIHTYTPVDTLHSLTTQYPRIEQHTHELCTTKDTLADKTHAKSYTPTHTQHSTWQ